LFKRWEHTAWTAWLFPSGDEPEIGDWLIKMKRIMRQCQSQIHCHETAVTGRVPMPLPIDADNDVAPIPHRRAKMSFLVIGKVPIRGRA
jgi:hypothetical protein